MHKDTENYRQQPAKKRPVKKVEDLYLLLFRLDYTMKHVCDSCGIKSVTPSRWKAQGLEPRDQTFSRVLAAMIDMGIKDGKLPERARGCSVEEVLRIGVIG